MTTNRQPKGIPTGGEFASNGHDESGVPLIADEPTAMLYERTYIEEGTMLYVLSDGERVEASAQEFADYEFAVSTLHEDEDELANYRRMNALAVHLDVDMSDIEDSGEDPEHYYGLPMYEVNGERWIVGNDEQAQAAARTYATEHLWSTNPDTIAEETGVDAEAIRAIQQSMYENANEPLKKIVEATGDLDSFVDNIIESDGRGNGLSGWDGTEQEVETQLGDQTTKFFAYRWD